VAEGPGERTRTRPLARRRTRHCGDTAGGLRGWRVSRLCPASRLSALTARAEPLCVMSTWKRRRAGMRCATAARHCCTPALFHVHVLAGFSPGPWILPWTNQRPPRHAPAPPSPPSHQCQAAAAEPWPRRERHSYPEQLPPLSSGPPDEATSHKHAACSHLPHARRLRQLVVPAFLCPSAPASLLPWVPATHDPVTSRRPRDHQAVLHGCAPLP
jgi:hypothetical protein